MLSPLSVCATPNPPPPVFQKQLEFYVTLVFDFAPRFLWKFAVAHEINLKFPGSGNLGPQTRRCHDIVCEDKTTGNQQTPTDWICNLNAEESSGVHLFLLRLTEYLQTTRWLRGPLTQCSFESNFYTRRWKCTAAANTSACIWGFRWLTFAHSSSEVGRKSLTHWEIVFRVACPCRA